MPCPMHSRVAFLASSISSPPHHQQCSLRNLSPAPPPRTHFSSLTLGPGEGMETGKMS